MGGSSAAGTAAIGGGSGDWSANCGDVTVNGRCTGNVYEWCDYFSGEKRSLNCTTLGMTCRASVSEPNEFDLNGCVGSACGMADLHCDDHLMYDCHQDQTIVTDCRKIGGADGVCAKSTDGYVDCSGGPPCSEASHACDGSVVRICTEDNTLAYRDCARNVPGGSYEAINASAVNCGGIFVSFFR